MFIFTDIHTNRQKAAAMVVMTTDTGGILLEEGW